MCGITGIYNCGSKAPVSETLLREMTGVLSHRGPDGEGFYFNGNIGMGHRRLSIIDLEGGSQPIYNEKKDIVIVFNGEIYNFPELRKELVNKGHVFYTNTDTEAIVHLYEDMGERCVEKLRGMFAFALWDSRKKKMFLARDRVGKKPLYYYYDRERLVFASELKSILIDKTIKREISNEALTDYLVFLCVIAPKTIFKNVYKLNAGNILTCDPNGINIKEYWDLHPQINASLDENAYAGRLFDILKDAVQCRLISDVSLGAFLSGGMDSSTVTCLMSEIKKDKVITTSIGFREKDFDESHYARLAARHFSTEHHEEIVESNAVDQIDEIIWFLDEPFADASAIPTYDLSRAARKHVKVALSGDGGDEIFAGYRRYYYDNLENRVRHFIPAIIRATLLRGAADIYPKAEWVPRILRAKTFLQNLSSTQERSHFNSVSAYNDLERNSILNQDMLLALNGYHPFSVMEGYYNKTGDVDDLTKILYVDFKTYLPDRMLVKVDRMSMANSLEVRCPFLDHKLLEFAAQMPSALKLKGRQGKYILKKTMESRLPGEIINRSKKGFDIPLDLWFRTDLKNKAYDCIFSRNAFLKNYFNYDFITGMWDQHQKGQRNWGQHLWSLYVLELWSKRFLD
jgi:asparagine synthase (glutamine-hydrolysing)